MSNFGNIKTKLLTKLTEAFTSEDKSQAKNILKGIKSSKNLTEMYLFYEDVENKYIADKETAILFVEQVESLLGKKTNEVKSLCESLEKQLSGVEASSNEVYDALDTLSESNTLWNIDKKVFAKQRLVKHLMTKKEVVVEESTIHTENENLLNTVLVNNFNIKFGDFLSEEQKETFKNIVSLSESELNIQIDTIKNELNQKIDSLLSESNDSELRNKLNSVKTEVNESKNSKFNYYRLMTLKEGFN